VAEGGILAHVLVADRYGNLGLDVERQDVAGSGLRLGREVAVNGRRALYATTFADVPAGGLALYEDGYRALSIAVDRGSALQTLGLDLDAEVRIEPAR